jgi:hypothetical protein
MSEEKCFICGTGIAGIIVLILFGLILGLCYRCQSIHERATMKCFEQKEKECWRYE